MMSAESETEDTTDLNIFNNVFRQVFTVINFLSKVPVVHFTAAKRRRKKQPIMTSLESIKMLICIT